ncbi:MAG: hypothetical protein KJO67_09685 [Silicimonas sp.]|nr:hypothetical protein [Silicimonas sp.]
MDVKGRDPETECYRVTHEVDGRTVTAMVPERFASDLRLVGARPSHQDAYVWMAEHKTKIETAIDQLARGKRPAAPFDQIVLVKDS